MAVYGDNDASGDEEVISTIDDVVNVIIGFKSRLIKLYLSFRDKPEFILHHLLSVFLLTIRVCISI